jgi:hypothetical protein
MLRLFRAEEDSIEIKSHKNNEYKQSNKGMLSITCSKAWNTLFQGLGQVVPGLGIPLKEAFL